MQRSRTDWSPLLTHISFSVDTQKEDINLDIF